MSNFDIGNIFSTQNYSGIVDSTNPFDIYNFNLSSSGSFQASLSGLSKNADVQLLGTSGNILYSSSNSGATPELISVENLPAGDYAIRVTQVDGLTNYNLSLTGAEIGKQETTNSQVDPVTGLGITSGYFNVGKTGEIGVKFRYDGGWYKGELAVFSLEGLEKFTPGSTEFIQEVAKRSLSNSPEGYVVISDATEDASLSGGLGDPNYNDGQYKGVKTFAMKPNDTFGFMLVPNGTVQEVFNNPNIEGNKRPLFSLVTANPNQAFHVGQIANLNDGGVFVMEDQRVDSGSDQDYNDIIFEVTGATGKAVDVDEVINPAKDWRGSEQGKKFIDSIQAESPIDPTPPVDLTPVDPKPVDPTPPIDSTPIDPTPPIDPKPVDPTPPIDSTPIDPKPVDPTPPIDSTPIDPKPVDPTPPIDSTPIDPTPPVDPNPPVDLQPKIDPNQPLIGVIDTGFSGNNPDIDYRRILLGSDRISNDNNPLLSPGEGNEHGTHILGLIAAIQGNGIGIDGINDKAQIWLGRAVGSGGWADSLIEFVDAARASQQRNAVVNLSLDLTQVNPDGSITTRYELTPKERQAIEYARQNRVIIVTAAGNDGGVMSVLGQASQEFDNIITVGASNGLNRANYSSYGNGLDILTEGGTIENPVLSTVSNGLGTMEGTSVAAAKVTGVASLVWAANPDLNFKQVIQILQSTATDLNASGWDGDTGFGLLNSAAAVELAKKTIGESYTPEAWVTPFTWDGEGKVTPTERAAQGGNSISTATQFSPTFSDNDKVDSTTPEKYYQFTVNQSGYVRYTLTRTNGSNEFPALSLIKADGTPGGFKFVPGGPVVFATAEAIGSAPTLPISRTDGVFVEPGTYYFKVRGGANNSIQNYNLSNQFIPDSVSTFQTPVIYSTLPYFDFNPDLQSKAFSGISAPGLNVSGEVEYKFVNFIKRTAKYGFEVKEPGKLNLNVLSPNGTVDVIVEKFVGSQDSTVNLTSYEVRPNSNNYLPEIHLNKGRYQIEIRGNGYEVNSIDQLLKLPYTLTGVFSRLAPKPGEGNVPIAGGNFIKTVTSNGVDTHYYNNGYLTVQPKGYSTWYAYGTGNPIPEISVSAIPIEAPPDYAGNTLGTARDLGNLGLNGEISYSVGARDFVGDVDKYDYYRFNFNQNNTFKLRLQDLSADAKVELIQDINNNGQVDQGEILESTAGGTTAQLINRTPLQNGIYYVRVSSNKSWADTNYSLDLTAVAIPTDTIKKYTFEYYYGNGTFLNGQYTGGGDWYKGYVYAKDGSYFKNQIIAQQTFNSSGNKGFYKITDDSIAGSSSDVGKVHIIFYSDNDSSKGIFKPAYNVNYALSNQGLGTEYDYIGTQLFNKGVELDLGDEDGNNSMSTAEFLTLNQTNVGKRIGGGIDREDYYRFSLNQISDVNIQMYGMTAKVGFEVIKDLNNNGRVDSNEKLNISRASTTHQSLNTTFSPGNYYICVFPENPNDLNGRTNYNLFVSATPELAGNTIGKAYNVGLLNSYKNFTGLLRTDHDNDDYYRFELNRPSNFNLKLEGVNTTQLGGVGIDGGVPNTLVQLIRDTNNNGQVDANEVLQGSSGNPTTRGAINTSLEPGNYFVRVSPDISSSVNTSYNLNLYAEARPIALDRWNAKFINRDPGNVADFNSYNFSNPVVVLDLGSQTNGDGKIRLYKDFGLSSPAPKVQSDNFAMEASTMTRLDAGKLYKVTTKSDDGTQFFLTKVGSVESKLNLEYFGGWSSGDWRDRGASEPEKTIYFKVPESGDYVFDIQYYEKGLDSKIDVTLEETKPFEEPTDGSKWRSSVFWWDRNQGDKPPTDFWIDGNNLMAVLNQGSSDLGGGKKGINFDWGNGSANNDPRLPGDNFAIRSYTQANFEAGKKYRFTVRGDDGFQILAKNWDLPENDPNKWVYITPKDQWQQSYGDTVYEFTLPDNARSGGYDLHFHYYEQGGDANFNLSWEEVSPPEKPDIKIELVDHYGHFTPSQWAKIQQAAANWERIITKDKDSSGILRISVNKGQTQEPGWLADTWEDEAFNYRTNFDKPDVDLDGVDYDNNIRFNSSKFSYTENNNLLVRLAMHEIGNALGLPDDNGSPNLMNHDYLNPLITETMYRRLEERGYSVDRNAFVDWNESNNSGGGGSNNGGGSSGNYYPNLASLTSDQWDEYSGDNTRFDNGWPDYRDDSYLTPEQFRQPMKDIYTELSKTVVGDRYRMTAGYLHDPGYHATITNDQGLNVYHAGIDIDAPDWTDVKVLVGGETTLIYNQAGNYIMGVKADDGNLWLYTHLGDLKVAAGKRIEAGDVIGRVGSMASHLHLEIQKGHTYQPTWRQGNQFDFVKQATISPLQAFWEWKNKQNASDSSGSNPGGTLIRTGAPGGGNPGSSSPGGGFVTIDATPIDPDNKPSPYYANDLGTLNGSFIRNGDIGYTYDYGKDEKDYYSFKVNKDNTRINLSLDRLTGQIWDAGLELRDENDSLLNTSIYAIGRTLNKGTYYVGVSSIGSAKTNYKLRLVELAGKIEYPFTPGGIAPDSYPVNIQLYDRNGVSFSNGIDPNKDTIVVIHGRTWQKKDDLYTNDGLYIRPDGSPGYEGLPGLPLHELAKVLAEKNPSSQVIALDWREASRDDGQPPFAGGGNIRPVAEWAKEKLTQLGIKADKISLIGHSLGSYVSAEIGKMFGKVSSLVALDPAIDLVAITGLDIPLFAYDVDSRTAEREGVTKFRDAAIKSRAFVATDFLGIDAVSFLGGTAGDPKRAATAAQSFVVTFDGAVNPPGGDARHEDIINVYTDIIKRGLLDSQIPYITDTDKYNDAGDTFFFSERRHEGVINAKRWQVIDWKI